MANSRKKQDKQAGILARVGDLLTGGEEASSPRDENATTMLKEDHDRVRKLFREYDALGEGASAEKQRIASKVSWELAIHAELEEKLFYPACMKGKEDAEKIVRESFEEHKIVKTLLAEIARLSPGDEQFDAKVTVLKESVEHHAKEEEDDLFPEAEDLIGDEGLRRLGGEMKDLKEELSQRAMAATARKAKREVPSRSRPARSRSRAGSSRPRTKKSRSRRSRSRAYA